MERNVAQRIASVWPPSSLSPRRWSTRALRRRARSMQAPQTAVRRAVATLLCAMPRWSRKRRSRLTRGPRPPRTVRSPTRWRTQLPWTQDGTLRRDRRRLQYRHAIMRRTATHDLHRFGNVPERRCAVLGKHSGVSQRSMRGMQPGSDGVLREWPADVQRWWRVGWPRRLPSGHARVHRRRELCLPEFVLRVPRRRLR